MAHIPSRADDQKFVEEDGAGQPPEGVQVMQPVAVPVSVLSELIGESMAKFDNVPLYGSVLEPLFNPADVGAVLGISRPRIGDYSAFEVEKRWISLIVNGRGGSQMRKSYEKTMLTEAGLYRMVYSSRTGIGEQFRAYVAFVLKKLRIHKEIELITTQQEFAKLREDIARQTERHQRQLEVLEGRTRTLAEFKQKTTRCVLNLRMISNLDIQLLNALLETYPAYYIYLVNSDNVRDGMMYNADPRARTCPFVNTLSYGGEGFSELIVDDGMFDDELYYSISVNDSKASAEAKKYRYAHTIRMPKSVHDSVKTVLCDKYTTSTKNVFQISVSRIIELSNELFIRELAEYHERRRR